jgi:hypothetical protein
MSLPPSDDLLSFLLFCQQAYLSWTNRIEEERRRGSQIGVDVCTAIRNTIHVRYPILSDFGLLEDVCSAHMERYPQAPPPFLGPAYFQFTDPSFEGQDVWNERMLRDQKDRFSVHVDRERFYEVHGLGLPFERLYFEAREQLVQATNALGRLRAERVRENAATFARTNRRRSI